MSTTIRNALHWSPRILGIATALFLSVFALDAFSEQQSLLASIPGFLLHLTPALAVLGTIYIAWRRPLLGAIVFLSFAALYTASSFDHPSWILAIGAPVGLVGLLYLIDWRTRPRS